MYPTACCAAAGALAHGGCGGWGLQGFADLGSMRIALRAIYRGRRLGLGCCMRKLPVGFAWSCVRRGIDDGRGVVANAQLEK